MRRVIITLAIILAAIALGGLAWLAGLRDMAAAKTFLDSLRDVTFSLAQALAVLMLLTFIVILVHWMSRRVGTAILPFENATGEDKYNGKAISDSLIAELQRIRQIHLIGHEGIQPEELGLPNLAPNNESLNEGIAEMGTVGVGETTVSIGRLLVTLKRMWPVGDPGSVITGSLQKYGDTFRLVARMEYRDIRAWEVHRKVESDDQLPELIQDLAYKIARDLSPDVSAKTWRGFKHFTEALDAYRRYTQTGRPEDLKGAQENCLAAAQAEQGYTILFALLYNLGIATFEKADYAKAAELFRHATVLNPKDADAFSGLGASLECLEQNEEAERAYRRATELNPKDAYPRHGLGNVYAAQDRTDEAIAEYKRAAELDPRYAYPHNSLGYLYRSLGRADQAAAEYQRAIELEPQNAAFHASLAGLYRKLSRQAEYEEHARIAREFMAEQSDYDRAWIESVCGNADKAIELLQQAIVRAPGDRLLARDDPDFDFIRGDSRFKALVSGKKRRAAPPASGKRQGGAARKQASARP